jgi:hypothetical protein
MSFALPICIAHVALLICYGFGYCEICIRELVIIDNFLGLRVALFFTII